jgi:hypothetical protein
MIFFLLHAFFATGIAYLLSWIFGSLTPTIAVVSLLMGAWMGRRRARTLRRVFPDLDFTAFAAGESGALEVILTIIVFYVSVRHFLWLLFPLEAKLMTLHANNFGDLPLHINYIREMANGVSFPPLNPSFASEPLRYPFGPDLYNALWEILGVPLSSHLFVVGALSTVVALTVLRWFGSWWAIGAFFFSGGLAGWTVLRGIPITGDLLQGIDWKNLFLSVYITQRGVLFALPAGLLLIESTRRIYFGNARPTKTVLTTLGLVWGLLPLFHLHAFVIVSIIMGLLTIVSSFKSDGRQSLFALLWSRMAVFAYIPAIYFVLRSSDALKKSSIVHWDSWWTSSAAEAPNFMIQNFGPWLLLPLFIFITLVTSKTLSSSVRKVLLLEFFIYLGLFAIFFNVMLAPWAWDNIKILIFPYLGFSRLAWVVLDPVFPGFSKYIAAFILFFSGFLAVELSLAPPVNRGQIIYTTPVLGLFEGALAEVPRNAVFAAAPTHDHPLTYFGRLRAVGYEGHLWSHGIEYKNKMDQLTALMRAQPGSDVAALAHQLGVTHVVWGPAETGFYTTEPTWPVTFRNVSRVTDVKIYEVPK